VGQLCGDFDFAQEALAPYGRRELRPQHLDGYEAVVPLVPREEDDRHPAATEFTLDRVTPGKGGLETGGQVGHA
jgi:hypothetical protein